MSDNINNCEINCFQTYKRIFEFRTFFVDLSNWGQVPYLF